MEKLYGIEFLLVLFFIWKVCKVGISEFCLISLCRELLVVGNENIYVKFLKRISEKLNLVL